MEGLQLLQPSGQGPTSTHHGGPRPGDPLQLLPGALGDGFPGGGGVDQFWHRAGWKPETLQKLETLGVLLIVATDPLLSVGDFLGRGSGPPS
jgi:hypothetical protein